MSLEVIITSGGTIEPIDDVRCIANFSQGTTSALIAEEFLRKGAIVHYVHSKRAERPYRTRMKVDASQPIDAEFARVRKEYDEYQSHAPRLHEYAFNTFDEYYALVHRLTTQTKADAIVLAAAVSDYGIQRAPGKIGSDKDELTLHLSKNPKIISLVKQWNKGIFQVGFKLLSNVTFEQLVDTAYKHGITNHSDLTVANAMSDDMKQRTIVLITPEKGLTPVKCADLAPTLVEKVQQRVSHQHYRTVLHSEPRHPALQSLEFRNAVQRLYNYNLFEPYFENAASQFGFVAMRMPEGFLITARGSDKKHLPAEDITYVRRTDFAKRAIDVVSSGKKASLNANIAAQVFAERPDINLVVHAHVFPGVTNVGGTDYAPGTDEDRQEAWKYLRNERIVELPNHGIVAVGSTVEDIVASLSVDPAYTTFAHYYDAIYHRFSATDLIDLVVKTTLPEESVLDLAAGTGNVSASLKDRGYRNVCIADKSKAMLGVARQKLPEVQQFVADMASLDLGTAFDAIVVRQAINYLMDYDGLVRGLASIRMNLRPGGRLIFNAPNAVDSTPKEYTYDSHGYHVTVSEMNLVEGKMLTHTQRCTLRKLDNSELIKLYDINKFGIFTEEDFSAALRDAGYSAATFYGKGLGGVANSKSLYCAAQK
ncbi:methyltransferase domain-containing protein [Candidatus Woesearchaeota archaeon]|nr:methyltransferase domain-containing protein [Candidatus Woesearchaeota archaeon]